MWYANVVYEILIVYGVVLPKSTTFWSKLGQTCYMAAHISMTLMFHNKSLPDLNMGRRPKLKSAKFCLWNILVSELWHIRRFSAIFDDGKSAAVAKILILFDWYGIGMPYHF